MRIIALKHNILETEIEQRFHCWIELEPRQRARRAGKLQARLFQMILIKMRIS